MTEPKSFEEYTARFHNNQVVTGYGVAGTTMHLPCPFCAAPNYSVYRIVDIYDMGGETLTCDECKRSGQFVIQRHGGASSIEYIQTDGSDPPSYLKHPPRRVNDGI